ncbi:MAG: chromosome partitioning protein ParB, partial [Actinomycetia bacterium]|nr:chromosome partitioning protein ParB [Actinomycetes bacterium]
KRIGKSRTAITNSLRLLTLPLEVQKILDDNLISEGHARALIAIGGMEEQIKMAKKIAEKGMSVREVENLVDRQKQKNDNPDRKETIQFARIPKITERLSRYLDSPVKITMSKKKGKIDIEITTIADLERVVGKIIG